MTIRIAHLSDTHFGGELKAAVDAAIDAVAEFDPTVVVVTGDLTLNGLPREFLAAKSWLARFSQPLVVTPGNHDTPYWNIPLRALRPFDRFRRFIGPPSAVAFDAAGVAVRSLNSARGAQPRLDWSKGAVALDKLRAIHWGDGAPLKVFACHHPLIDIQGAPVTGGVRRGPQAAAALAEAGVDLVMTGHVHVPFALGLGPSGQGCYAIGAGHPVAPDPGRAAKLLDDRGEPGRLHRGSPSLDGRALRGRRRLGADAKGEGRLTARLGGASLVKVRNER